MGIKSEGGDINKPVLAPEVAQQPGDSRLLDAQNILGNMQIHPDNWKGWQEGPKLAILQNRINPAEFFSDMTEFAAGSIAAQNLPPQQIAAIFREAWTNGIILNYVTYKEKAQKNAPHYEQQIGADVLIPDTMRRIFRLAAGDYYWANEGQNYTAWQPFLDEITRRSKGAENPEVYLTSLRPAYSLINKALATQSFTSKENSTKSFWNEHDANSSHLTKYGRALTGRDGQKINEQCFKGLSSYIRALLNTVNLHEGVKDPNWIVPDQEKSREKIFGYNKPSPKWIEDEQKREQIRRLQAKFEEIKNIGAGNQHWQLAIALPTWQKFDKKGEQYEYQLDPSSDDFIETTLLLMEEQIDYIKRNGDKMWQSVQEEEAERTRWMWEKHLKPTREKISILDQEIEVLRIDSMRLDGQITDLSQTLETLKEMMASTKQELEGKRAGMFGRDKLLGDIQVMLSNLIKSIKLETDQIEKTGPPLNEKSKISPNVEPQALLDSNDQYSKEQKGLEQELKDKEFQKITSETSKNDKKLELQNIQVAIGSLKEIANECLAYTQQISATNPGKKGINGLLLPTLIEKLKKAQRTSP